MNEDEEADADDLASEVDTDKLTGQNISGSFLTGNWRLTGHFFFGIPSKCLRQHIKTDTRCFVRLYVPFFAGKTVLNLASWVIGRKRFDFEHLTLEVTRVYNKQSKYGG